MSAGNGAAKKGDLEALRDKILGGRVDTLESAYNEHGKSLGRVEGRLAQIENILIAISRAGFVERLELLDGKMDELRDQLMDLAEAIKKP